MFANDANLFLAHKDISYLFETTNPHLEKISQWFFSTIGFLEISGGVEVRFCDVLKGIEMEH